MSGLQGLKVFINQRLTAAVEEIFGHLEKTITEYEEEMDRRRCTLLDVFFKPEIRLRREDVQHLLMKQEEVDSEQSPSLDQEDPPEPPHIKEEQEELWTSQEGEQLRGLEEADITEFPFTPVPVKSEEDEEKPQSSQLHQRLTEQMETGSDGEDCGGPEPARNSDPDRHLEPDTEDQTEESSEPETEDSEDDCEETRKPEKSGLNYLKVNTGSNTGNKSFSCSDCGRRYGHMIDLKTHIKIHTGEKPFGRSVCGERYTKEGLKQHKSDPTEDKPFSCSICDRSFYWYQHFRRHRCVGRQSSQFHQRQTKKNRLAEPPASSSTKQIKTQGDGEDCGGPEPARNSDPNRPLQPDTEDQTEDCSEAETEDSEDD